MPKENYTKNITMPTTEEIKAFAEAEGFEVRTCGHFGRLIAVNHKCELCGGTGEYFFMHETAWPPAAIEMMMADRARRNEIAAAAKDASAALHHARGKNDFAERERGLNEVNQQLMKIWTTAQGARIG
jgi:hypothetical protein